MIKCECSEIELCFACRTAGDLFGEAAYLRRQGESSLAENLESIAVNLETKLKESYETRSNLSKQIPQGV